MFKFQVLINQTEAISLDNFSWKSQATKELIETLSNENFPCVFARRSNDLKGLLFLFIDSINLPISSKDYDFHNLINGLVEYTEFCKQIPAKDRLYFPLIIVFNISFHSLQLSQSKAWDILIDIYRENIKKFPLNSCTDENQNTWKFTFNNVKLFFNINHPQHKQHLSRNVNSFLTMVVNPSENFGIVAPIVNGERKISNLIRNRVEKYNNGFVADTLGINDGEKPDWKQYQHEEADAVLPLTCPFVHTGEIK